MVVVYLGHQRNQHHVEVVAGQIDQILHVLEIFPENHVREETIPSGDDQMGAMEVVTRVFPCDLHGMGVFPFYFFPLEIKVCQGDHALVPKPMHLLPPSDVVAIFLCHPLGVVANDPEHLLVEMENHHRLEGKAADLFHLVEKEVDATHPLGMVGDPTHLLEMVVGPFHLSEMVADPSHLLEMVDDPFHLLEKAAVPFHLLERVADLFHLLERVASL